MSNDILSNKFDNDNNEDGYESDGEITIEITNNINGKCEIQTYSVPYKLTNSNEKRLICFSKINKQKCNYKEKCTYAHNLEEQIIDLDKKFVYQIILDKDLMNFYLLSNPKKDEIYRQLLIYTQLCEYCYKNKCTGGYNCRNGIFTSSLKLCRNDLLTGECINKIINLNIEQFIIDKFCDSITVPDAYKGCINGHHLSERKLLPYYKYIHEKENSRKNRYQSVRYIDVNSVNRLFNNNNYISNNFNNESDSSTDEEINDWFKKNVSSDEED